MDQYRCEIRANLLTNVYDYIKCKMKCIIPVEKKDNLIPEVSFLLPRLNYLSNSEIIFTYLA